MALTCNGFHGLILPSFEISALTDSEDHGFFLVMCILEQNLNLRFIVNYVNTTHLHSFRLYRSCNILYIRSERS